MLELNAQPSSNVLESQRARRLSGRVSPPGDKSISHRALLLGSLAVGRTTVRGLLEGEDVLRTAEAMRSLGAEVERDADGTWEIHGVGVGGLSEPANVLDMGNSGTAARLISGLLASHNFTSVVTGDASLCARPMNRVIVPLQQMGADFVTRSGGRLPMTVIGAAAPVPINYRLPVASAQVKSAVLLAGLNTAGQTTVIEPAPTRDHTEIMLRHFGADITIAEGDGGGRCVSLIGQPELRARDIVVPGDPSSAAFLAVAALLAEEADLTIENVGLNPLRAGLFTCLQEMCGNIEIAERRDLAGETVANLRVRSADLTGITVPAERAPSMIDEYPILCVAAACAKGKTVMRGLGELRVKESDRIAAMATGLTKCGVRVEELEDGLIVHGAGTPPLGGTTIDSAMDHRIAMSFLILGMASKKATTVTGAETIDTSFPGFMQVMNRIGGQIGVVGS